MGIAQEHWFETQKYSPKLVGKGQYKACSCWWNQLPPAKSVFQGRDQSSISAFRQFCDCHRQHYTINIFRCINSLEPGVISYTGHKCCGLLQISRSFSSHVPLPPSHMSSITGMKSCPGRNRMKTSLCSRAYLCAQGMLSTNQVSHWPWHKG